MTPLLAQAEWPAPQKVVLTASLSVLSGGVLLFVLRRLVFLRRFDELEGLDTCGSGSGSHSS